MKTTSQSRDGYLRWFSIFFQEVVRPRTSLIFFYGVISGVRDFLSIVAFFIPLKVVMALSNPEIFKSRFFDIGKINIEEFLYYSCICFFSLMFLSLACHIFLKISVYRSAKSMWEKKKDIFSSRTKYRNLFQVMVDTITHLVIIVVGCACVLYLDKYLAIPVLITLFFFIVSSKLLARHTKNELSSAPLKSPALVYKVISETGFALTFLSIIAEYYFNTDMNFLFTLLALLMSRVILRNIQQLFIKHRRLLDDYYRAVC